MPSLGADMLEGTLVEWRIAPGKSVKRGDIVALIDTEKGVIDVEAFHDGVTEKLLVEPGSRVPVGTVLALFSGTAAQPTAAAAPVTAAAPAVAPVPVTRTETAAHRTKASPAARARAHALGIALEGVTGTGTGGAITIEDVERAVRAPAAPVAAKAAMRRAIGAAMARSKREIPHYYLAMTVDFTPARTWLEQFNANRPVEERLLYPVLLVKAVARAAREVPGFNGYFRGQRFEPAADVNVGVAISQRGGGLVAPALLGAADKDLPSLMRELNELVSRARTGHLRSSELELPTITLTSLGEDDVDSVQPIIFPDQVAIVGAAGLVERPWVVDRCVQPRTLMTLTLAADHRVSDGRAGARFLKRIGALAASPGDL
jgi:pyruvate dehydrogenase E2 component (dihydrolipoamide acetyltransferase)